MTRRQDAHEFQQLNLLKQTMFKLQRLCGFTLRALAGTKAISERISIDYGADTMTSWALR